MRPVSAAWSPALEAIRASTAEVHRELEQRLEIARDDAGEGAYRRYLSAVLGWLEPLERQLWTASWPTPALPIGRSGKADWIASDLRARGLSALEIAQIPRQSSLPPLDTLAQRFGVAYVVEGAQLGGQHLLRTLGPRLSPLPVRWLEGYGRDSAHKWRSFLGELAAHLHDRADAQLAAQSARITFELARHWFVQRGAA